MMQRLIVMTTILGFASAMACGPIFPPSYLEGDGSAYDPEVSLRHEIELVMSSWRPAILARFPRHGKARQEAESDDFRQAAAKALPERKPAAELLAAYAAWQEKARNPQEDVAPAPDLPEPLREFRLYVEGVRQMHEAGQETGPQLPPAWQALLSLPPEHRQFRTTWVHYTFGNMCLSAGKLGQAEEQYRLVQEAVENGFADSLALGGAAFRKLFVCATDRLERLKRAMPAVVYGHDDALHYLRHEATYGNIPPEERPALIGDELAREILAARLMASRWEDCGAADFLADLAGEKINHGERLAYIAYRAGDMATTERFLAATPDSSMLKWWLQAKVCRWRGDNAGAAAALGKWLNIHGATRPAEPPRLSFRSEYCEERTLREEVKGLLGTLLVEQRDYLEALYTFIEAGSWWDAAFVAERLVDLEALKRFVDASCPPPPAAVVETGYHLDGVAFSKDPARLRLELRQLLGRRLARSGRFAEAGNYLPPPHAENLALYAGQLKLAKTASRSATDRAAAFYNAAKLLRHHGIDIVGCELYPDARIWDGSFEEAEIPRLLSEKGREAVRRDAGRTLPSPTLRFHYRYQAADLMRQASALAPHDDFRVVACYVGGIWIEAREPQRAEPFYKELARIRTHPVAKAADQQRWFPSQVPQSLADESRNCELRTYDEIVAIGRQ